MNYFKCYFVLCFLLSIPFTLQGSHFYDAYLEMRERDGNLYMCHSYPRVLLEMFDKEKSSTIKVVIKTQMEIHFRHLIDSLEGRISVYEDEISNAEMKLQHESDQSEINHLKHEIQQKGIFLNVTVEQLEKSKIIAYEYLSKIGVSL